MTNFPHTQEPASTTCLAPWYILEGTTLRVPAFVEWRCLILGASLLVGRKCGIASAEEMAQHSEWQNDRPPGAGVLSHQLDPGLARTDRMSQAVDVGRSRYICRLDPFREPVTHALRNSQPLRRRYFLLVLTLHVARWHHSFVLWTGFVGRTYQPAEHPGAELL